MKLAPISLFVYNRPEHTRRTIEALKANQWASSSDLIIFSDNAKDARDEKSVARVREYIRLVSGFRTVEIYLREKNFGLAKSITSGITQVLEKNDRIIVLEDDIVTSPFFLKYMNTSLDVYEPDERVISVHGYLYPIAEQFTRAFFLKGADCWGWATWRRGWKLFNSDGAYLYSEIKKQGLLYDFNFCNTYPYGQMLKDQVDGKNNSWAILWYASAFLSDRLTLYPGRSLVHNIGNDGSGTHNTNARYFDTELNESIVQLDDIPVRHSQAAYLAISRFFSKTQPNILRRGMFQLNRILKCDWLTRARF